MKVARLDNWVACHSRNLVLTLGRPEGSALVNFYIKAGRAVDRANLPICTSATRQNFRICPEGHLLWRIRFRVSGRSTDWGQERQVDQCALGSAAIEAHAVSPSAFNGHDVLISLHLLKVAKDALDVLRERVAHSLHANSFRITVGKNLSRICRTCPI